MRNSCHIVSYTMQNWIHTKSSWSIIEDSRRLHDRRSHSSCPRGGGTHLHLGNHGLLQLRHPQNVPQTLGPPTCDNPIHHKTLLMIATYFKLTSQFIYNSLYDSSSLIPNTYESQSTSLPTATVARKSEPEVAKLCTECSLNVFPAIVRR